jgi:hypothetical protein
VATAFPFGVSSVLIMVIRDATSASGGGGGDGWLGWLLGARGGAAGVAAPCTCHRPSVTLTTLAELRAFAAGAEVRGGGDGTG